MLSDLQDLEVPDEILVEAQEELDSRAGDYAVWRENMPTLDLFIDLATSWDRSMKGQRTGIRATEIESAMRLMGVVRKARSRVYEDIRLMERAALAVLGDAAA